MKYGKTFILLVLAIFLFSLTGAFASEIDTPVASEDTGQLELSVNEEAIEDNLQTSEENTKLAVEENNETLSYEIDAEILTADQFNYTNLKEQIGSGGNINLNKGTYTYNDGDGDTIQISTSGVINGNGAVIDMAQSGHRAFEVTVTDVTIKNLTIKNANYNGNGGAIYFSNSGTVTNCNFTNNSARYGGAIEFDGTGNVTNCNFTNNTATYQGGAIWMYSGSVENCNFTNNSASNRGGAVYFYGNGDVTNCNFTNNKATGGDSCGGAILMYSGNVTNCNFTNNSASSQGGAIRFSSTGTVTNCNFTNNSASGDGGAVYFDWEGTVENCNFTNNTATNGDGGAIWMYSGSVENCNFTNNKATGDYSYGGAILFTGTGNVTNCNFANNRANEGGAIFSWGWYSTADTCIFKSESDTFNNNVFIVSPKLNVDNFTTFYGSCEKLTFNLTTDSGMPVTNGNISISAYFKNNNSWVGNYSCLSGEGWIPDLPVGAYYAIFDTEYAEFQPINRTIKIIPNIPYYVNVTSLTTHNKTVNITAKSNIPQDILEGKLLFILPNGTEINATYASNGTWWAIHTFDDYAVYHINASYVGLDNVTVNNATINITKADSTMTVDNVTLNYGDSTNLTVTTEGATGIKANINGTNVTVINNYTITIADLGVGNYTLTVTTIPDEDHNPVTETAKITVNKGHAEITVDPVAVDMKVLDEVPSGAALTPADAGNLTYKSSNDTVIIVKDGKIKALGEGNATITVSFNGNDNYSAAENKTVTVTVNLKDASVIVNNSTLNLMVGDTFTIVPTTTPEGLNVTYVPDNSGIISVDNNGIVTALKEGTTSIIVKVGGDGVYAENSTTIAVSVSKVPTEITVDTASLDLKVGDETVIAADLTPADAGNVTFTSSDEELVIVDAQGNVIANGKGQVNITVSFAGDDKYARAENKTITVNVSLNDASVTVDNNTLDLKVDETGAINASKHPDTILLDITYTSSNSSVATVDENGIVTAVGEGTAIITVEVGDDEIYAKNSTNITVTVSKIPTEITLNNETLNLKVNDEVSAAVNLTPSDAGNATFTSSDDNVVSVDGEGYVKAIGAGKANITVSFAGDYKYAAALNKTISVTVSLKDACVSAEDIELNVGNTATIKAVSIPEGLEITYIPDNSGVVTVENGIVTAVKEGTTTITLKVGGDGVYALNSTNITVTVSKQDANVNVSIPENVTAGDNSTVNVVLPDDATGNVTVKVDGEIVDTVPVTDGTADVTIPCLSAGNHTVEIAYSGDGKYNSASKTSAITVGKPSTNITAADVTATYKINKYLIVKLTDSKGNPLANAPVTVELSASKNYTSDENGQIKVKVSSLVPKTYTAKITFKGDEKYAGSNTTAEVTVKKATAKITAKAKTFKTTTKIKKYTVTLKANGKALKNKWVYLKVNGKKYKAKTNSKGKATFKITKLNKAGKFKATVTFKGNDYYKKATKKATIKVKSVWKTISKGSKNSAIVKKIQKALKNHGYYLEYNGRYLKVDGIFWDYTEMAVKEFQNDKTLKVTGKVDEKTAKKLGII